MNPVVAELLVANGPVPIQVYNIPLPPGAVPLYIPGGVGCSPPFWFTNFAINTVGFLPQVIARRASFALSHTSTKASKTFGEATSIIQR